MSLFMEPLIYMHSLFLFQEMVDAYKSTKDKWRAFSYEKAIIAIKVRAKQSSEWTKDKKIHTDYNATKFGYEDTDPQGIYICGVS